jgi:hypothetical protein
LEWTEADPSFHCTFLLMPDDKISRIDLVVREQKGFSNDFQ